MSRDNSKRLFTEKQEFHIKEFGWRIILFMVFYNILDRFLANYLAHGRMTDLFTMVYLGMMAFFSLLRRMPISFSMKPQDWIVASIASWLPLLTVPVGSQEYVLASVLQLIGTVISAAGLLSLNRSFAIVPANRGIKTSGMYRIVRHPLYAGYIISDIGILLNNFSAWNVAVLMPAAVCQFIRIHMEEKFLKEDEVYRAFMEKTKYRIIPYVW